MVMVTRLVAGRTFAGENLFTPMLAGVLVFMFLPLAKRCVVGGAVGFLIFAVGFHDFLCWRKGALLELPLVFRFLFLFFMIFYVGEKVLVGGAVGYQFLSLAFMFFMLAKRCIVGCSEVPLVLRFLPLVFNCYMLAKRCVVRGTLHHITFTIQYITFRKLKHPEPHLVVTGRLAGDMHSI